MHPASAAQPVINGYIRTLVLVLASCWAVAAATDPASFCHTETFLAECAPDQVILITSALYGRMRMGKCVKEDLGGYIGCYQDVTREMDQMCSGRRNCQVAIPHAALENTKPCSSELKNYLEAAYTCVKVIAPMNSCTDNTPIHLGRTDGYLSSAVAATSGCGLEGSPWILGAKPGQKIAVTLFDFNYGSLPKLSPAISDTHCAPYAVLDDVSAQKKINVCPSLTRSAEVYVSENNSLQVTFLRPRPGQELSYAVLYFEVHGCPDLAVPPDMVFERVSATSARVSCAGVHIRYHLTCQERSWIGDFRNCSKQEDPNTRPRTDPQHSLSGILLAVFVAIGLIAGLSIIALFIYCYYRHRRCRVPRIPMDYRDTYGRTGRNEVIYACKAHSNHELLSDNTRDFDGSCDYAAYKSMPLRACSVGHPTRCAHCEEFLRDGARDETLPEVFYPHEIACNMHNERIYVPVRAPTSPRYGVGRTFGKETNLDVGNKTDTEIKKYHKPQSPDVIEIPRTPKITNQLNNKRQIARNNSCDNNLDSTDSSAKKITPKSPAPLPRHVSVTNSMGTL